MAQTNISKGPKVTSTRIDRPYQSAFAAYDMPNIAPREPDNLLYESLSKRSGLIVEEISMFVEQEINELIDEIGVVIRQPHGRSTCEGLCPKDKTDPIHEGGLEDIS